VACGGLLPPASGLRPLASGLRHPASGIPPLAFGLRPSAFQGPGFGPQGLSFWGTGALFLASAVFGHRALNTKWPAIFYDRSHGKFEEEIPFAPHGRFQSWPIRGGYPFGTFLFHCSMTPGTKTQLLTCIFTITGVVYFLEVVVNPLVMPALKSLSILVAAWAQPGFGLRPPPNIIIAIAKYKIGIHDHPKSESRTVSTGPNVWVPAWIVRLIWYCASSSRCTVAVASTVVVMLQSH